MDRKTIFEFICFLTCLLITGFMAPLDAHSQEAPTMQKVAIQVPAPVVKVEIGGYTKDKKYPLYVLQGDYNDISWHAGDVQYNSWDLIGQLEFIDEKDVNHPYRCGFVCKDLAKNIVGLNPAYKYLVKNK